MDDSKDRSLIRNIGLFLVLVVLINGLILPGPASSAGLLATFYLAVFFHAGFTLYDGSFGTLRTATWLLLTGLWAGAEMAAFFGYVLPAGPLTFWLVSELAALPIIGEMLFKWFAKNIPQMPEASALWPILLLSLLSLDAAVMHREAWRKSSLLRISIFLAAACAGALLFGLAVGGLISLIGAPAPSPRDMADIGALPAPPKIVPDWYFLPFYALLRAIPDKLAGVAVMFAAMAVPAVWPWMGADVLRKGPARWVWGLLCLALAAVWIGLTYLGSRSPDPVVIRAARVLAVLYFAFFLVWPLLLRKIVLRGTADRQ